MNYQMSYLFRALKYLVFKEQNTIVKKRTTRESAELLFDAGKSTLYARYTYTMKLGKESERVTD